MEQEDAESKSKGAAETWESRIPPMYRGHSPSKDKARIAPHTLQTAAGRVAKTRENAEASAREKTLGPRKRTC